MTTKIILPDGLIRNGVILDRGTVVAIDEIRPAIPGVRGEVAVFTATNRFGRTVRASALETEFKYLEVN